MKGLLIVLAFMVVIALAAAGTLSYPHTHLQVPTIGVKIVGEDAWTGPTTFLPLVNGYSSTFNSVSGGSYGGDGGYTVNASYKVDSSSPGHFFVLAHYKITRHEISTEVDKALPVLPSYTPSPIAEEKLKRVTWSSLDNRLCAFAYMSDQKISY